MVASRKVHCAYCNKKCSGNVLRYQDHYYHKQCFELEQSELAAASQSRQAEPQVESATGGSSLGTGELQEAGARSQTLSHSKSYHSSTTHIQTSGLGASSQPDLSSRASRQQQQQPGQEMTSGAGLAQASPQEHQSSRLKGSTMEAAGRSGASQPAGPRSATLPHSSSSPAKGSLAGSGVGKAAGAKCAGCRERITDGQALIALEAHWHVWCFKCAHCKAALHGEYVAREGRAYCERDYQKLFGIACVYCKRYITGKVLQAGEAHHFHPSCARCSKCGDPFVPGEEMYLQGEVTWHPRCGPGPLDQAPGPADEGYAGGSSRSQLRASRAQSPSLSSRSRSRSASPFSFMSRQYGRASPAYADSEAVGDLSRIYTISYLNADPTQGYLRRPIEPNPPKSPQFSRPTSTSRLAAGSELRSRCSSRSQYGLSTISAREQSVPRGMYSVLSSMRSGSSSRARSPSMMNEEAIQLAAYPSGQKPSPDAVPKIERDDFPAPPFPYPNSERERTCRQAGKQQAANNGISSAATAPTSGQQRASRPRSRELVIDDLVAANGDSDSINEPEEGDPRLRKEEEELSKIANGIGKIFLQTLKEREKLRAWKRANLDPRNASRTPSATRELSHRMRYDNPTNASPSRDLDRPRPWDEEAEEELVGAANSGERSPTRTRSSLGKPSQMSASSSSYGYKVVQSNRSTPKPGYGLAPGGAVGAASQSDFGRHNGDMSFSDQQRYAQNRSMDLLGRAANGPIGGGQIPSEMGPKSGHSARSLASSTAHLRRSMPNVAQLQHLHSEGPPKLYPYHLLATSNYRLPPDVDRCHLERHLSNEEFQYIFHCDRLDFYRLPEWRRNELKRRAKLF